MKISKTDVCREDWPVYSMQMLHADSQPTSHVSLYSSGYNQEQVQLTMQANLTLTAEVTQLKSKVASDGKQLLFLRREILRFRKVKRHTCLLLDFNAWYRRGADETLQNVL